MTLVWVSAVSLALLIVGSAVAILQNWIKRPTTIRIASRTIAVTNRKILAAMAVCIGVAWALGILLQVVTNSQNGGTSTQPNTAPSPNLVIDAPIDHSLPYPVPRPAPHATSNRYPRVEMSLKSIVNRGHPVSVTFSGFDFIANGNYRIELFTPQGTTVYNSPGETSDEGLFSKSILWEPYQSLGIAGNNGAWKLRFTDLTSGVEQLAQIDVTSDAATPPPSEWNHDVKPSSNPNISAGTSGKLCSGVGAMATIYVSGFSPGADLRLDFFRPDGRRIAHEGLTADGQGKVSLVQRYWKTQNCASSIEFTYIIVVTDEQSGQTVKSGIPLYTV